MGKRIQQQRRGRGTETYRAVKRTKVRGGRGIRHPSQVTKGTIVDLIHDPARHAPVAVVEFEREESSSIKEGEEKDKVIKNVLAPEGVMVGDEITINSRAKDPQPGDVKPLRWIPEGTTLHNIENQPGDGGKFARSPGTFGFIVTHKKNSTQVRLPSKKFKELNPNCKAAIGRVAGSGRKDQPLAKAGKKHHASKGKKYPKVSAVAMNAVDHPFGGSASPGKPKSSSRMAPPGKKVGSVAAKRTGKRK